MMRGEKNTAEYKPLMIRKEHVDGDDPRERPEHRSDAGRTCLPETAIPLRMIERLFSLVRPLRETAIWRHDAFRTKLSFCVG